MSIIIRGMKIPKQGRVTLQIGADGAVYVVDKCEITAEKYEKNFRVYEVQPHGRLIDADALLADVRAHSESYFADDFAHEWVDVAPTVIEAESYSERGLQRDYEASVEYAQHYGRYEPTYNPDTGAM